MTEPYLIGRRPILPTYSRSLCRRIFSHSRHARTVRRSRYRFREIAVQEIAFSAESGDPEATFAARTNPARASAPSMETQDHETIQGTASGPDDGGSPITSYDWRYKEAGPGNPWISVTGETALVVDFDGLNAETDYRFQVKARNSIGLSSRWSPSGSAETDAEPVTVQEAAFSAESGDPEANFNATAIDPPAIPTQEIAFEATSGNPEATFNATAIAAPTVSDSEHRVYRHVRRPRSDLQRNRHRSGYSGGRIHSDFRGPGSDVRGNRHRSCRDRQPGPRAGYAGNDRQAEAWAAGTSCCRWPGSRSLGTKNEFYEPSVVQVRQRSSGR